ncbi:biotin-dependent carboxyltransferase family protein [Winogradskyella sp. DF17]|uniref:Biotin-dependent carboxyltransferase family protein n=1 Tax=Winogradskyella pelagia TaxID=2819984 RepID=A0ABS3T3Z5_9FLAO|nr:biotin-dependent carboxyltransferase family protein [Winogradskyella sp. DF17]MBO3117464.1 biotin-dependent carboxyltransferase family protein [Winogradskyella sp. DF17]
MTEVIKPGFYTTIQDLGRLGYGAHGVPVSGSMDMYSAKFANLLLGNTEEAAVLEITIIGPTLKFLSPTTIAIVGAPMRPKLNGIAINNNQPLALKSNDILSFGPSVNGARCYIAIKGGFNTPLVLGSRSFYEGITEFPKINKGEIIPYLSIDKELAKKNASLKYDETVLTTKFLNVSFGPEYHLLSRSQQDEIWSSQFVVSKFNNRMAYQLENLIDNDAKNIITAPVLPGTVQLTPSGQLIVLMRDAQTTGGYPRILQLTDKSINALSQKTVGNYIKFRRIA